MRRSDFARRSWNRPPRGAGGFSLVEALIVIGVLGIVAALGVPSLLNQLARYKLESTAISVANLMRQTRMRAIRDNDQYTVAISGNKITGVGAFDDELVEVVPEDPVAIYAGADPECLSADGSSAIYDANSITYQGNGQATGSGAICVHDGRGNILQVVVEFPALPPVIRKHMLGADSPSGAEGFFEKTSAATADSAWWWYN